MTAVLAAAAAACGAAENPGGVAWQAVHDTLGDTLVVRTVAGSIWGGAAELVPEVRIGVFEGEEEYMFGEVNALAVAPDGAIYVFDRQAKALRKYAPDGRFVANFGREGGGPGEHRNPDSGLAVLPDGRVLQRDPGNARINLYSSEGEPLGSLPTRGGFFTSDPLYVDTAGNVATWITLDLDKPFGERRSGLARMRPDGTPIDTIVEPAYDHTRAMVRAERGEGDNRSVSISTVPFTPTTDWTLSPHGYVVGGVATRYAVEVFRPDGKVVRIERAYEPVPVAAGEKSDSERRTTASMRRLDPGWRWNGPAIPDVKPPFRSILTGEDGRIWVQLHQPGREVQVDEPEADRPGSVPPPRWREPVAFDLFEPDGRYLGQVRAPEGFSTYPRPVLRGDRVWAVVRDDDDVQYVVRFRIETTATPSSSP